MTQMGQEWSLVKTVTMFNFRCFKTPLQLQTDDDDDDEAESSDRQPLLVVI